VSQDAENKRAAIQHILQNYLHLFSQQRWDEWIDLWADDGVLEFPIAPPGRRRRYVGKPEILAYMKPLAGRMKVEEVEYFRVHPMLDPAMSCVEMAVRGRILKTDAPYNQKYISIIETKGGKVSRYTEYWNPLVSIDANGGREAWTAAFGSPETESRAMSGLVLVTGGTGKTGRSLAAQLQEKRLPYRAASRHGVPPFDWEQPSTWDAALEDVASIYLVAPGTLKNPYAMMQDFIALAMRKGIRRFVFLSMAGLPAGGPAHGQVHRWLKDNSDDWAVLCPSAFMQNFSAGPSLATIRDEDRIYSNTGDGRVPFIDVHDIAAAALAVLTAPTPQNTEFVLTGGEPLSYDQVAAVISQACGRRVMHIHISMDEMAERLVKRGIPEAHARMLALGYQTIAAGVSDRTTDEIRTLTGRPPTTFQTFAEANADVWRRAQ
jgi:uncharacterized protein YbjT (DUF2867 family)/ketosteroid isomerase-like protein